MHVYVGINSKTSRVLGLLGLRPTQVYVVYNYNVLDRVQTKW
jgi:hypothetical protein